jgi:hypothetical protein
LLDAIELLLEHLDLFDLRPQRLVQPVERRAQFNNPNGRSGDKLAYIEVTPRRRALRQGP